MSKYDCNKVLDYKHEINRACGMYERCTNGCPIWGESGCVDISDVTQEDIDRLQRWSDENPEAPKLTKRDLTFLKAFGGCYRDRRIRKGYDGSVYYIFDSVATALAKGMFEDMETDTEMTFEELLELETGEEE